MVSLIAHNLSAVSLKEGSLTFLHRHCSIDHFPPLLTNEPMFHFGDHSLKVLWTAVHQLIKLCKLQYSTGRENSLN